MVAEKEPAEEAKGEDTTEQENERIDFSNVEGRKQYLKKKLDDIMDSIGDSYGKALMEELIFRLEKTVKDFNQEVDRMIKKLHELEVKRQKFIDTEESEEEEIVEGEESEEEMSEFERRLEQQERIKTEKEEKVENKRKGLFRR